MLYIVILALVTLSIVNCMEENTSIQSVKNLRLNITCSDKNMCKHIALDKTVTLKTYKSHSDFLRRRIDSLKQWKRRRRTADNIKLEKKGNGRLKNIEGFDEDVELYQNRYSDRIKDLNVSKTSLGIIVKFIKRWPVQEWRKFGLYTDDYLMSINMYWLQFPPPDALFLYTFASTYIVLGSIGCFGNVLVLLMYCRCRSLRTAGNILVANLALSDFLMLSITPIFIFNSFNLGPALGKTGCVIYGFVGGLTGTTSIATLSAIALDRYWAVVRPLEPLRALTAIRARLFAIGAWIYACIFAIIPALDIGYGSYVPEGFLTSCSFDYLTEEFSPRMFILIFFCAAWLAPFCTIAFCYISIFRVVVWGTNMQINNQEHTSKHVKEGTKRKAEIKLAFLVMAVIALFFVSWTPYAVVALLGITGKKELLTPVTSMIPALFCKTAACINPFIYIITHPKFRNEFKKMICKGRSSYRTGTIKTIGYYTEATKSHRPSKDLSDTDVEIVEMKDIPYQTEKKISGKMKTISSRVAERDDLIRSISIKSFEGCAINPPSWYTKPQFVKKKSFRRHSTRSNLSQNTDPTV